MTDAPQRPPASPTTEQPPPGWGNDELTKYLDNARNNQWAAYAKKPAAVAKLIAIDATFFKISRDWLNPKNELAAFLLLRCHSAYRAAAADAMAGQVADSIPNCRAMLEYAAYAAHIDRNPELKEIWWDRHKDEDSTSTQRKAFWHSKVLASVTAANQHAGKRFEDLYQMTIDFGGHPNERAITSSLQMVEEPGQRKMSAILQHGDGVPLDFILKNVARCGLVSLEMLQVVFNARFELLGVNASMLELRKGL